ncbi:hypothetical protein [Heyndrickxia coagulans]|uniref:hypothetical protein n=1 Tax=Heyndrickxia coagulans TaxID=1398 RepID=UPI0006287472|nr:hypothetical protein [Heyndrickxia coagulans]
MIGYIVSLIGFNLAAFCVKKRLSPGQIIQIWTFTIASHLVFDVYIDYKYHGYWYFTKGVDWENLPGMVCLLPPVNILYLNWFPFGKAWTKKVLYIAIWEALTLGYEVIALLPAPWGYFHYGWWNFTISVLVNPFLLLSVVGFYKWIVWLENKKTVPADQQLQ